MKRILLVWAIIGAAVPLFWGILGFILFNAPQNIWADIFWYSVYVTCPPWLLPENDLSWLITPLLNGALYSGLALLLLSAAKLVKSRRIDV
jgi:hypothetical protein